MSFRTAFLGFVRSLTQIGAGSEIRDSQARLFARRYEVGERLGLPRYNVSEFPIGVLLYPQLPAQLGEVLCVGIAF
jgi:hypothetical protein